MQQSCTFLFFLFNVFWFYKRILFYKDLNKIDYIFTKGLHSPDNKRIWVVKVFKGMSFAFIYSLFVHLIYIKPL